MRIRAWTIGGLVGLLAGLLLLSGPARTQDLSRTQDLARTQDRARDQDSTRTEEMRLVLHPKSQFQIRGNASIRSFTCAVQQVDGRARLPAQRDTVPDTVPEQQTEVVVQMPVQAFDCGNGRMTDDLQEALNMEEHPEIRFELIHATVGAPTDTSRQWRKVNAIGALSISGTKRVVRLEAIGHALDASHFRLRGCTPLKMTDFNVDPPSKAFGLIRVKDRVEAQFDLLAYAADGSAATLDSFSLDSPPSC